MTEQEQKAIKWMQNVRDDAVVTLDHIAKEEPNVSPMLYAGRKEKAETIIKGFEELEQYREIGTVREFKSCKRFGSIEKILSSQIFLDQYQEIGTVEECRAAVEKQKAKKPIIEYEQMQDSVTEIEWKCPVCGTNYIELTPCGEWCRYCGQKLDWSDEE